MKLNLITVAIVEPGSDVKLCEITATLESYQSIVGGYIEFVTMPIRPFCLIVNENGRIDNLPFNRSIGGIDICGTAFLCRYDFAIDDLASLEKSDMQSIVQLFAMP